MNPAITALLAAVALAGCASTPDSELGGIHIPASAPATMEVNWQRVGYFELQKKCGAPPYSPILKSNTGGAREIAGCAIRRANVCTIWTTDRVYLETIGHEVVLHCFLGIDHQMQRNELAPIPIKAF